MRSRVTRVKTSLPLDAYCNVVFDANATDAFDIHTRFYGNHISCFKSNRLPAGHPRLLVHFQTQAMPRAMHEILFESATSSELPAPQHPHLRRLLRAFTAAMAA